MWHGRGRERGGKRARVYVFPHYKFNLTNGSENLETMEYMKCGRVYHADGGDAGWYRRQYCQGRSIFSESAAARGSSGGQARRGKGAKVVPARAGRTSERQNMLLAQEIAFLCIRMPRISIPRFSRGDNPPSRCDLYREFGTLLRNRKSYEKCVKK